MKQAFSALKSQITSKCLGNCRLSYEQAFWCWIIKIHITIYTKYTWQGYSKPNVTDQSIFYTLNNLYNKQNKINLNIRKALESKFMFFFITNNLRIMWKHAFLIQQNGRKVAYKIDQPSDFVGDSNFI